MCSSDLKVMLLAPTPIPAVVRQLCPWRERTQLLFQVKGSDELGLTVGRRVALKRAAPQADVDDAQLPAGLDGRRTRAERIEWFLASIYCTCGVPGDICTGHFYTLASCNPNGCGMPNHMRKEIAALIDKGLSDEQIFEDLLKDQGPNLLKPHLMR